MLCGNAVADCLSREASMRPDCTRALLLAPQFVARSLRAAAQGVGGIGGNRDVVTEKRGAFQFLHLVPGTYSVKAELAGFHAHVARPECRWRSAAERARRVERLRLRHAAFSVGD